MFTVYVLYSKKIDALYIGQTKDVGKRLVEHLSGNSLYTKRANDWILIYTEEFQTRAEAIKREKQLKSYRGREFIRSKMSGGC